MEKPRRLSGLREDSRRHPAFDISHGRHRGVRARHPRHERSVPVAGRHRGRHGQRFPAEERESQLVGQQSGAGRHRHPRCHPLPGRGFRCGVGFHRLPSSRLGAVHTPGRQNVEVQQNHGQGRYRHRLRLGPRRPGQLCHQPDRRHRSGHGEGEGDQRDPRRKDVS